MTPFYGFLAGVVFAALHTLTLWWTVASLQPKSSGRALLLVWCGSLLRSSMVGAAFAAAASHSLHLVVLTLAGFVLARLALTRLISERLGNSKVALQG